MPPNKNPNEQRAHDAAASLGLATNLSQMLMPNAGQQSIQGSQTPKNAPQQEQKPKVKKDTAPDEDEAKMTKLELDMSKKLDDLRKELDDKHKLEIDSLKKDIELALQEEETNEQKN